MNEIQTQSEIRGFINEIRESGKSFDIEEGSNYVVMTSFDRHYVVDFKQAMSIIKNLFATEADFITVNNTILNKKYIQCIEPTKEKTSLQREELEKQREEERKKQARKDELEKIKKTFDIEFFNARYGEGEWKLHHFGTFNSKNEKQVHVITAKDRQDCWNAFCAKYPNKSKEIENL